MAPQQQGEDIALDMVRVGNNPPAVGLHHVQILDCVKRNSQNSGNDYLLWTLQIIGERDPERGRKFTPMTSLTENSRWVLERWLDALGAPIKGKLLVSTFKGKQLRVKISHRERKQTDPNPGESVVIKVVQVDEVYSAGPSAKLPAAPPAQAAARESGEAAPEAVAAAAPAA